MLVAERDGCRRGLRVDQGDGAVRLYVDPAGGRGAGRCCWRAEDEVGGVAPAVLSLQATLNAVPSTAKHGFMRQARSTVRRGGRDLAVLDMVKTLS